MGSNASGKSDARMMAGMIIDIDDGGLQAFEVPLAHVTVEREVQSDTMFPDEVQVRSYFFHSLGSRFNL